MKVRREQWVFAVFQGVGAIVAIGVGLLSQPVLAQPRESIVVTGSRLERTNLEAMVPTFTVSPAMFEDIGVHNFADLATQLPQFAPAFQASRTQSTFGGVAVSGLNNANLRNLGPQRSLVLINGRRGAGGSSTDGAVDFNSIPTANIARIEIITGGTAAVYGADAVAGVINIITKKDFEGVEIAGGYGATFEGDNTNPNASILVGGKFGAGGRTLLTFQYDKQGQVSCKDRYICAEDFDWRSPGTQLRGPRAYSAVALAGRFFDAATGDSYTRRNGSYTNPDGSLIPFVTAIDGYNRNPNRDIAIPTTRILVATEFEYPLSKAVNFFGEVNYANIATDSSFEAHPFQSSNTFAGGPGGLSLLIPRDNPLIPAAINAAFGPGDINWTQRFAGLGRNRGGDTSRDTIRTVAGVRGSFDSLFGLGNNWSWEASYVWAQTKVSLNTEGGVGLNELYNGLHIEADPTRPGSYRCISAAARAQGCVPINPFADYTPAQTNYVNLGSNAFGTSKLNNVVAYVTGSAYELPAGQVRTVLGAEYRSFSGFLNYDPLTSKGLLTGNQILDTDFNKTTTREVFGELYLPILADKEWAKSLSLEGAYRYSDVEGGGNYNTWKYGGDWEPITGLRFRAVKAKAVRTPTPDDLSGIGTTAGVVNDPCTASRRNSNPTRAANCAADGIPANYVPPLAVEQGVLGLTGGNPNLEPETSKTLTYGVVWEPTFLKNFSVSVDRFEIDVNKIITEVSRQLSVNTCYDTTNRVLCGAVTRGTSPLVFGATYVLLGVNERLENVAKLKVAGIDLNARYSFKAGEYGDVDLSLIATFYDKATLLPLKGEDLIDLLGQAGGSTDDQGWVRRTGNANIGWRMGPYNANWNIRYIGPADMAPGTTEAGYPKIGTYIYNNIKVGYQFAKASEIFFGITNLFDKQPPFFASGTSGTQALDTIPGYYDVFGRAYFLGARYKF